MPETEPQVRNTARCEGVDGLRFSNQLMAELYQPFWTAWQGGEFLTDAAALAGTHRHRGLAWLREAGGVRPRRGRNLKGRCLSFAEREEIALERAAGETVRAIAGRLGRAPSTVSREITRNRDAKGNYRATTAHALAYDRASRPKPAKLATNLVLRRRVEDDLAKKYSPEQIAGRLRADHPEDPEMWVTSRMVSAPRVGLQRRQDPDRPYWRIWVRLSRVQRASLRRHVTDQTFHSGDPANPGTAPHGDAHTARVQRGSDTCRAHPDHSGLGGLLRVQGMRTIDRRTVDLMM
jgi:hypothetical protein